MIRKIVSLLLIFSFLVISPSLMASDIRMMGLANPWLVIPDSDTDWQYNPAFLANAPEQVYTQYIFGYADSKQSWSDQYDAVNWHSTRGEGVFRSHAGELGYIHSLGKGKLAITSGYSSSSADVFGTSYTRDDVWSSRTHFPDEFNRDANVTAAYVYPVNQDFSLGITGSWDRVDNHKKNFNVSDGNEDTTASIYNRWDCTLGLAWQIKSDMSLGLSAGAGGLPGDYDYEENAMFPAIVEYTRGKGDYNGTQAHFLGNLKYQLNERLNLSTIVRGRWQKETYGTDLSYLGDPAGGNKNRDKAWDALFGIGGLYTINKDSGFLVGAGIYYTYADWLHKYNEEAGGMYFNTDKEQSNNVELRIGTEKKLFGELVGRGGVYYRYSFIDKYELFDGGAHYELLGNGFTRTLGIGLGLGYSFSKSARLDLGFDIPIVADHMTKVNGSYGDTPGNSHRDSEFRDYRVGLNFAYLF